MRKADLDNRGLLTMWAAIEIPSQPEGFYRFVERFSEITATPFTETDRFNELPGFECELIFLSCTLIGPDPDSPEGDSYRLDVYGKAGGCKATDIRSSSEFERTFLVPTMQGEAKQVNFSKVLAETIEMLGVVGCRPVLSD